MVHILKVIYSVISIDQYINLRTSIITFLFTIITTIQYRSNTIWDFYQILSITVTVRYSTITVPWVRKIIIPRHYRLSNQDTIIDIQSIAMRAITIRYGTVLQTYVQPVNWYSNILFGTYLYFRI